MTLKRKRANKTETNERKKSDLTGLLNGYKRVNANARLKKRHARELSRNQTILRFDVILQRDWPIEQYLLILGFSLAGKRRVHLLILIFIHCLIK